jgi:branched-chain amino acid transport system permease protein
MAEVGLLGGLSSAQAGALRFVLVGILLVLIVIWRPQGMVGDKRELTFVK